MKKDINKLLGDIVIETISETVDRIGTETIRCTERKIIYNNKTYMFCDRYLDDSGGEDELPYSEYSSETTLDGELFDMDTDLYDTIKHIKYGR